MSQTKEEQTTELAKKSGFAAVQALDVLNDALADDCAGLEFQIDRIKIPAGGGTQFELPEDINGEVVSIPELTGVILYHKPMYAYYRTAYEGGNNPPDCGSYDGVNGYGTPGGLCSKCPYNEFGSGQGQSKACKNKRLVFLIREGEIFPVELTIPPGSLKTFTNFVKSQLTKQRRLNEMVTKIHIKRATNAKGIAYAQVMFSFVRMLDEDEKRVIAGMTAQVKAYADALNPAALIATDEEPPVDPETGEAVVPL